MSNPTTPASHGPTGRAALGTLMPHLAPERHHVYRDVTALALLAALIAAGFGSLGSGTGADRGRSAGGGAGQNVAAGCRPNAGVDGVVAAALPGCAAADGGTDERPAGPLRQRRTDPAVG